MPSFTDCDIDDNELRSRRDLSFDNATEERLEGLEAAVQELQKSIKTLRRKIKQLSLHHCHDTSGILRQDSESWVKDNCTRCLCKVCILSLFDPRRHLYIS